MGLYSIDDYKGRGAIKTIGTDIDKILPPMSLFGGRAKKKALVLEKLNKYFEKYKGLI